MKKRLLALPLIALIALTGCTTGKQVGIGDSLNVDVKSPTVSTDGVLEMTVAEVERRNLADVPELDFGADYTGGTLFLTQITATLSEGTYEEKDLYTLGPKQWQAEGSEPLATVESGFRASIDDVDGCEILTDELTLELSAGKPIQFCQMFVAPGSGAELSEVVFDKPMISRRGADKGWRWTVAERD